MKEREILFMNGVEDLRDLEEHLVELINKYNLYYTDTEKFIISKWNDIDINLKVAIWGAGVHTEKLLELINIKNKRLICIIDRDPALHGTFLQGIQVCSPEVIEKEDIDLVFISSYRFRKEISSYVTLKYKSCKYVDVYAEYGIIYGNIPEVPSFLPNKWIDSTVVRKFYEDPNTNKERYAFDLIVWYLRDRDLLYAEFFIKEYISKNYNNKPLFIEFLKEFNEMLTSIKNIMTSRKNNDINFFLIDSLRERDLIHMPFLMELRKKSIDFKKAYSTSTYTAASMFSVFSNKLPFENNGLRFMKKIPFQDYLLFNSFYKKNYKIFISSSMSFMPENAVVQIAPPENTLTQPIAMALWKCLCEIIREPKRDYFNFLHIIESHYPHNCGYHPNSDEYTQKMYVDLAAFNQKDDLVEKERLFFDLNNRYRECLRYIDKYLQFFMELVTRDSTNIFIGDHGQLLGEHQLIGNMLTCYDENIHVPVIVYNEKYKSYEYNSLFSLLDLQEQLLHILKNGVVKELKYEYIVVERDPVYADCFIKNKYFNEIFEKKYFEAYIVIRCETSKFILYYDGTEEYYVLPDEECNLINNIKYTDDISKMKSYAEKFDFPDFPANKGQVFFK